MPDFRADSVDAKAPGESKIYTMDWTKGLTDGATISSSSWVVQTGLTKVLDAIVTGSLKASIQVSGGIAGGDYLCTNTIITSDSETLVKDGIVRVR